MKKFFKKILPVAIKLSGSMMALALVITTLSQNTTCLALYYQPKVPKSLLDTNDE